MSRQSNYDKFPSIPVPGQALEGWPEIVERLRGETGRGARVIAVECYPGVFFTEIECALCAGLRPAAVFRTEDLWKAPGEIDAIVGPDLTGDPVFGTMSAFVIEDLADPAKVQEIKRKLSAVSEGPFVIIGTGTHLLVPEPDVLVYADLARWEIQKRQRAGLIGNLAADNIDDRPALKYKRGFFLDWRVADRIKKTLLHRIDYYLDTNDRSSPKLVPGDAFLGALRVAVNRPFRVVPFFDPGPWGGQWMREVCGLDDGPPNYAWCFDCVPEENSILLDFGGIQLESPAINLVFLHPRELLGDAVHARFGTEFPIRFDFLDTMGGGNLSLQVHPLTEYIQDSFGMHYTQDESYYLLDAGGDACVYLGLKEHIDRGSMVRSLHEAQNGGRPFEAERFVNKWPVRKHDHFLIPAGTVHCSGRDSMVLEISATPYIFTFKLWDWGRLGLDGRPRPIHLDHGVANIQWERDTAWVRQNLINRIERVGDGAGWVEEKTGLHEREFIETRRHWFTGRAPHDSSGGVHVLNLVEGDEAVVESPTEAFDPFIVHYAETFIVPARVGTYTIRSPRGEHCATVRASVRTGA